MKNRNAGKIIGGFLAGAGIITYLLSSKDGKKIAEQAGAEAKKLLENAEGTTAQVKDQVKEKASGLADQVMDFVVSNRPMIENAVSALIGSFTKKK